MRKREGEGEREKQRGRGKRRGRNRERERESSIQPAWRTMGFSCILLIFPKVRVVGAWQSVVRELDGPVCTRVVYACVCVGGCVCTRTRGLRRSRCLRHSDEIPLLLALVLSPSPCRYSLSLLVQSRVVLLRHTSFYTPGRSLSIPFSSSHA